MPRPLGPNELRLQVVVTDTGCGIPNDRVPFLFERFMQADLSTTRRHGGTGLGLAICHSLVRLMGGHIGAESVVGRGSTFYLDIVVGVATDAVVQAHLAATGMLPASAGSAHGLAVVGSTHGGAAPDADASTGARDSVMGPSPPKSMLDTDDVGLRDYWRPTTESVEPAGGDAKKAHHGIDVAVVVDTARINREALTALLTTLGIQRVHRVETLEDALHLPDTNGAVFFVDGRLLHHDSEANATVATGAAAATAGASDASTTEAAALPTLTPATAGVLQRLGMAGPVVLLERRDALSGATAHGGSPRPRAGGVPVTSESLSMGSSFPHMTRGVPVPDGRDVAAVLVRPVRLKVLKALLERLAMGPRAVLSEDSAPAAGPSASPAMDAQGSLPASAGGPRILIVDDNTVNLMVTGRLLTRLGYASEAVTSGQEALDWLLSRAGDPARSTEVVFMDMSMPELDGVETARLVRAQWPVGGAAPLPYIVALTANSSDDDRERCARAGMDDFLAKPVKLSGMEGAIARFRVARRGAK